MNLNKGMRLSTGGFSETGEQVVSLKSERSRDEIFLLNDGVLTSYVYDPISDNGFTASGSAGVFNQKITDENRLLGNEKIVEIAGGDTIKVRYDSGLCIIGTRPFGAEFILTEKRDIARITQNAEYGVGSPIQYYKSGSGTEPLIPLLKDAGGNDIVAIFEGVGADHIVRLGDVEGEQIVGFVGGFTVTGSAGGYTLHTPLGNTIITNFGTFVRDVHGTESIDLYSQISSNSPDAVDYSGEFSPSHYAYIQNKRTDSINGWAGVGNVGYVVDMGDFAHMTVPIGASSGTIGAENTVITPTLDDIVYFVTTESGIKKVLGDGTLESIATTSVGGNALIDYIYQHDMSNHLAMDSGTKETEPFSVNGYSFGYGADHLVDADLQNM